MDAALIALTERGARFTFVGDPFRSRKEIPNEDIVDANFSQAEITDKEVEALLLLHNLQGISFWDRRISDRAIDLISTLPRLERLNLCGTLITDAAVPLLTEMKLIYLDVADTDISAEGVEMLRTKLPEAEILA